MQIAPLRGAMAALLLAVAAGGALAGNPRTELQRLLDDTWRWTLRHDPEMASSLGDTEAAGRWSDHSPEALDAQDAEARALAARLRRIDARRLGAEDRVSHELLAHELGLALERQRHPVLRTQVLSSVQGPHLALAGVLQDMPMASEADARRVLARLAAWPARVEQDMALQRQALRLGWLSHRASLQRVLEQLDGQLALAPREQPAFEPLRRLLAAGPDTHIARKWGTACAEDVSARARAVVSPLKACENPRAILPLLRDFDRELKSRGVNPGTSADLTVASVAVLLLQERLAQ